MRHAVVHFDSAEQTLASDFLDDRAVELTDISSEQLAHVVCVLGETLLNNDFDRSGRNCHSKRVATERTSVIAVVEEAKRLVVAYYATDGSNASAQGLTQRTDVRLDVLIHVAHKLARSTKSRLDLVRDKQHVILIAKFSYCPEITYVWNDDSTFTLDGLKHNGCGVWVSLKLLFDGLDIVVRNEREARSQRTNVVASSRVT